MLQSLELFEQLAQVVADHGVKIDELLVLVGDDGTLKALLLRQGQEHGRATHERLVVGADTLGQLLQNAGHQAPLSTRPFEDRAKPL
jgi:hypothetical protein